MVYNLVKQIYIVQNLVQSKTMMSPKTIFFGVNKTSICMTDIFAKGRVALGCNNGPIFLRKFKLHYSKK